MAEVSGAIRRYRAEARALSLRFARGECGGDDHARRIRQRRMTLARVGSWMWRDLIPLLVGHRIDDRLPLLKVFALGETASRPQLFQSLQLRTCATRVTGNFVQPSRRSGLRLGVLAQCHNAVAEFRVVV